MKKGKTSQLSGYENAKCSYGTVDAKKLKSVYILIQSWVEPVVNVDNWSRTTGMLERNIKHHLLEVVDPLIFEKHNIVDLDLRSSGIQLGKRSFMNLLRDRVKQIVNTLYGYPLMKSKHFILHKTKKQTV